MLRLHSESLIDPRAPFIAVFWVLLFKSRPVSSCLVSFSSFNPDQSSSLILFTGSFTTLAFIKGPDQFFWRNACRFGFV